MGEIFAAHVVPYNLICDMNMLPKSLILASAPPPKFIYDIGPIPSSVYPI